MKLLLDTQSMIWLLRESPRLGRRARRAVETAREGGPILVSAISFWETANLVEAGRIRLASSPAAWRDSVLGSGFDEIPVDGRIAVRASELLGAHPDVMDRFILASAEVSQAALMTSDQVLLKWRGPVRCVDATE